MHLHTIANSYRSNDARSLGAASHESDEFYDAVSSPVSILHRQASGGNVVHEHFGPSLATATRAPVQPYPITVRSDLAWCLVLQTGNASLKHYMFGKRPTKNSALQRVHG